MKSNSKIEELVDILQFVEHELEEVDAPIKIAVTMDVAVEEIFVNICHYAYGEDNIGGPSEINVSTTDHSIEVEFVDWGMEFNPLAKEDPDITLDASERGIGGLGIYMVKQSMDEVSYRRDGDKNVFTMKKIW